MLLGNSSCPLPPLVAVKSVVGCLYESKKIPGFRGFRRISVTYFLQRGKQSLHHELQCER